MGDVGDREGVEAWEKEWGRWGIGGGGRDGDAMDRVGMLEEEGG